MGAPGCDDASMIEVPVGDKPKVVTLVYPYYENPQFLKKQIEGWWEWSNVLASFVRLIIVDDCSPSQPALSVLRAAGPLPLLTRLFRIEVDIRWNWLAARNIGAHHGRGWLLITDMDHVVSESTVHACVYGKHDSSFIYRFSRREHTGQAIHPHPNSWFYTREMFWRIGGYDEACSGYYGTDGDYRRRCAKTAPIRILSNQLTRHEYQGDSSTTGYKRKQPEDAMVKQIIRQRGPHWKPKVLSFPYREEQLL